MSAEEINQVFERKVVHHCAPTLAGVKPSSLFNCVSMQQSHVQVPRKHLDAAVDECRAKIAKGGVSISVLVARESGALVLVYRPNAIKRVLQHAPSQDYLASHGYRTSSPQDCIESLRQRFVEYDCQQRIGSNCARCDFPHEVGLLLGYPFEDVMGFIAHEGRNGICCGKWKVYSNAEQARDTFDCFKEHTRVFDELFAQGTPIEELALLGRSA